VGRTRENKDGREMATVRVKVKLFGHRRRWKRRYEEKEARQRREEERNLFCFFG